MNRCSTTVTAAAPIRTKNTARSTPGILDARRAVFVRRARPGTRPIVRSYADPLVSVVIPVDQTTRRYPPVALDSLPARRCAREVIVVPNRAAAPDLTVYPFCASPPPTAARSPPATPVWRSPCAAGAVPLDADDYLTPDALRVMVEAYAASGDYIYSDWYALRAGQMDVHPWRPTTGREAWLESGQHAVTALIETAHARTVGGFDERMPGWEDLGLFIRLAIAGVRGRVPPAAAGVPPGDRHGARGQPAQKDGRYSPCCATATPAMQPGRNQ